MHAIVIPVVVCLVWPTSMFLQKWVNAAVHCPSLGAGACFAPGGGWLGGEGLKDEGAGVAEASATAGATMPRHKASRESALIVTHGQCVVKFDEENRVLEQGESVILPEDAWHAVQADPEFTAVHIMPKGIRFTFSG